ncbi:hypothetical protein E2C01_031436 [Portunus trituberculatus]|uniref:Uncharacterized protein n=1 Tax=Portunus trituberculatus TaxID=210409 RepID=A0A5B7ETF5_PORTR|nr:hypothetical protein [Portunus trituberculatus]
MNCGTRRGVLARGFVVLLPCFSAVGVSRELESEADSGIEDSNVPKFPGEKDEGKLTESLEFAFRIETSEQCVVQLNSDGWSPSLLVHALGGALVMESMK